MIEYIWAPTWRALELKCMLQHWPTTFLSVMRPMTVAAQRSMAAFRTLLTLLSSRHPLSIVDCICIKALMAGSPLAPFSKGVTVELRKLCLLRLCRLGLVLCRLWLMLCRLGLYHAQLCIWTVGLPWVPAPLTSIVARLGIITLCLFTGNVQMLWKAGMLSSRVAIWVCTLLPFCVLSLCVQVVRTGVYLRLGSTLCCISRLCLRPVLLRGRPVWVTIGVGRARSVLGCTMLLLSICCLTSVLLLCRLIRLMCLMRVGVIPLLLILCVTMQCFRPVLLLLLLLQ